jgi:phage tail-like protein
MPGLLSLVESTAKTTKKTAPKKKVTSTAKDVWKSVVELPVPAYQFSVEIDGDVVAFFQSVSGLAVQRKVEPQPEGGRNDYVLELPGPLSYGHVTLEVGLTSSKAFWDWMMSGRYDGKVSKKDIFLTQRRPNPIVGVPTFLEAKRWSLNQAFPVSWKLSSLSVDTTQKIAIETLELAFQYFELQD